MVAAPFLASPPAAASPPPGLAVIWPFGPGMFPEAMLTTPSLTSAQTEAEFAAAYTRSLHASLDDGTRVAARVTIATGMLVNEHTAYGDAPFILDVVNVQLCNPACRRVLIVMPTPAADQENVDNDE